ncbi:triphosphoribosyl-dephospho-CoA synthase, partial [bacterium]|nr:triphosphoribosyl-dephospho-CoA synthase [bacterium]
MRTHIAATPADLLVESQGEIACLWEVCSRKPGNVHPRAEFRDVGLIDFVLSASAVRTVLQRTHQGSVGWTIRRAVEETRRSTGSNTNLGIILLLFPLAHACRQRRPLRETLADVLAALSVSDAAEVFAAIRLATPGGLGDAPEQDVRDEPTVTLLEAMRLAADRDMVARQYANGFADVFDFGVPAFLAAFEKCGCVEAAIIDSQLRWLAEYPDSLIARKNGPVAAADVQARAREVLRRGGLDTPDGRRAGVGLDRHLRSDGNRLNP